MLAIDQLAFQMVQRREGEAVEIEECDVRGKSRRQAPDPLLQPHRARTTLETRS